MRLNEAVRRGLPVDSYGQGGFRIDGRVMLGSLLLTPAGAAAWPASSVAGLTPEDLAPVLDGSVDIVLLGTGADAAPPPPALREAFAAAGVGLDAMPTPSACRVYNVLLTEERRVAAALIAL